MATGSPHRKGETLVDRVYQQILQRILYRQWGDGHHVLEQEIADELGTSRTPVRLALSRLQSDGLIEVIPRHGIRVLPMSPREVRETYEIFTRLESLAVELAALNRPQESAFDPLEKANDEMVSALGASDTKAWVRADELFHLQLVTLSGNRMLNEVHRNFWGRAQRARLTMLCLIGTPARSTGEHAAILAAIRAGDGVKARWLLEAHFEPIIAYVNSSALMDGRAISLFSRDDIRGQQ